MQEDCTVNNCKYLGFQNSTVLKHNYVQHVHTELTGDSLHSKVWECVAVWESEGGERQI